MGSFQEAFEDEELISAENTKTTIVKRVQLPFTNLYCPDEVAHENIMLMWKCDEGVRYLYQRQQGNHAKQHMQN